MDPQAPATVYKWQPVMLVIEGRMECEDCNALAVFIVCEPDEDTPDVAGYGKHYRTQALCQSCWMRHENEDEDEE